MLLASHKRNENNCLTVAFLAKKKTFLAIFAYFGQLKMVVYTAIIRFFEIDSIFAKKVIQQKLMGGGSFFPPPPTRNRVKRYTFIRKLLVTQSLYFSE